MCTDQCKDTNAHVEHDQYVICNQSLTNDYLEGTRSFGSRAHLHPCLEKNSKKTRKIQKKSIFFVVVDNLTREVRPKNQLI